MKVGKLKELLKDVPDDAEVLAPGDDHSFHEIHVYHEDVLFFVDGWIWSEWYRGGEESGGKKVKAVICGGN